MTENFTSHKVLLVLSNPKKTPPLALGEEVRAIYESIRLSSRSTMIEITPLFAATVHDLRRALLREQFTIIHFLGHGSPKGLTFENEHGEVSVLPEGLIFENEHGEVFVPPMLALAELFAAQRSLQCVLLNACKTKGQGSIAAKLGVPYVIAMADAIMDADAIEFSRGFYDALAAGREVQTAYTEGLSAVHLARSGSKSFAAKIFERPVVGYLFVLFDRDDFHRIPLYKPVTLIGRKDEPEDRDCDVLLSSTYVRVSHRHAKLHLQDHQAFLEDLGSTYGTYVDGLPLGSPLIQVLPRQVLTLGGNDRNTPGVCGLHFSWHKYLPTLSID